MSSAVGKKILEHPYLEFAKSNLGHALHVFQVQS